MPADISEPKIIERGPYSVVGVYASYEGDEKGPAWGEASAELERRKGEVGNREGDSLLAFLYRPHKDDPSIAEEVRACFMGLEVTDLTQVPDGMTATRFSGGKYVTVECKANTENDAAVAVGEAIERLEAWISEHGYREGDACFCFSHEGADTPPFIQHVYVKLEELA
jgi:hypothetical protein